MELVVQRPAMLPATAREAANILEFRKHVLAAPQTQYKYEHLIHGGMYTRTVYVPANELIAGVKPKVPTVTIIVGDLTLYREGGNQRVTGYNVLPGSVGRMVACWTHSAAAVTMVLATKLTDVIEIQNATVEDAEFLPQILDPKWHTVIVTGE